MWLYLLASIGCDVGFVQNRWSALADGGEPGTEPEQINPEQAEPSAWDE